ncbi:hypothetical protein E6W36_15110 [Hankyongella ginsenosidimutans]|uniref:Teneurin-like YD-shell domain-containing protein n=1 Tax=Hankyongella ginsenosidimutans TaxID=1763828 RepID=A0A4D7C9C1_9SPHN|nr:hypothetical protein [Hankyongella ginsenosidimutans]QCI80358.1 hypothetical protein E6W36_15110 [Hankyongella ginsenosidimutans]
MSYSYDSAGRMTSATTAQGETAIAYDAAGHIAQITYPNGRSLAYGYDDAGRRTSMTDQDGHQQNYSYDSAGRLHTLGDESGTLVTYSYDAGGNLAREDKANGTWTTYSYDAASHLTAIDNHAPSGSVSSFVHYGYDDAGLRITQDTQDGHWAYGYDASGQLTAADFTSIKPGLADKHLSWTYDAAGNRTQSVEDGVVTHYTVNSLNQYTQVGDETFTYDADGNMVTRTGPVGTTTYSYDANNRISGITTPDGHSTTYEYDIFGNRSAQVQDGVRTEYLNDPSGLGNLVASFDTAGVATSHYQYGLGLETAADTSGSHSYYEADGVGSVTALTNVGGATANSYAYTPFGAELYGNESIANSFEFNGSLGVSTDPSGLTNMRAREYDPLLGKFCRKTQLQD